MVTVRSIVQRLDLLDCDIALDPDGTEAAYVDLTMTLKVRQHGLSAPAVMALESGIIDHEQLMTWVLSDVPQDGTLSEVQAQP
tara:strand:- start:624 stop:872 length:249 start_codon:yes stop_codon:yes gene_type:complete